MRDIKDVVIVGGGIAGLSAAWRLRHWDIRLLEADRRVGGRIKSERRGPYWMNWGGHVIAGAGSATDALLTEVGITALTVPGSLKGMAMNGKLLTTGPVATYPFRIPMPKRDRAAILRAGAKVGLGALRYNAMVRRHSAEPPLALQQRVYDFEDVRTFRDLTGDLPADAAKLFETVVTRSAGDVDEISAGCGIGYFSLVFFAGKGLNRNIVGGPATMTEAVSASLGEKVQLGAEVQEIVHRRDSVVVRYVQDGVEQEVEARAWSSRPPPAWPTGSVSTCRTTSARRSGRWPTGHTSAAPSSPTRPDPGPGTPPTRSRPPRARSRSHSTTRALSEAPRRPGNPGEA